MAGDLVAASGRGDRAGRWLVARRGWRDLTAPAGSCVIDCAGAFRLWLGCWACP